jgi:hypothetical protein
MARTTRSRIVTKKYAAKKRLKKSGGETITVIKKKQTSSFSMDKESLKHRIQIANPFASPEKITSLVKMYERWIDNTLNIPDFHSWLFDVVGAVWGGEFEYVSEKIIYGKKINKSGAVKIRGFYFDDRIYEPDGIGIKNIKNLEHSASHLDWRGYLRAITLRDAIGPKFYFTLRSGEQEHNLSLPRIKQSNSSKFLSGYSHLKSGELITTNSSKKYNKTHMNNIINIALTQWARESLHATGVNSPTPLEIAKKIESALQLIESARSNYCVHYNYRALFDSGKNRRKLFSITSEKTDDNQQHLCQRCTLPILCEHNFILREENVENTPIKSRRFEQFAKRVNNEFFCKWCGYKLVSAIDETLVDFNDSKDFSDAAEIALDQNFISNAGQILHLMNFKTFYTPQSIFRELEPHFVSLAGREMTDRARHIYQNLLVIAYLIKAYLESKTDKPFLASVKPKTQKEISSDRLGHAINSIMQLAEKHDAFNYLVPGFSRQKKVLEKIVGRLFSESRTRDLGESKFKKNFVGNGYIIIVDPLTTSVIGSIFERSYPELPINSRIDVFGDGANQYNFYSFMNSATTTPKSIDRTERKFPSVKQLLFPNEAADINYKMREMENFCTDGSLHQFVSNLCLNCGILRSQVRDDEKLLLKLYDQKFARTISSAKIKKQTRSAPSLDIKLNDPADYYKITGVDIKSAKSFFENAGKFQHVNHIRAIMDPNKLEDAEDYVEVQPDIVRRAIISYFTKFAINFKNPVPKILVDTYNKIISSHIPHSEKLSTYKKLLSTILVQTAKLPGALQFQKQFLVEANKTQEVYSYDIFEYERERDELFMKKVINFVTNASKTMDQKIKELFGDNADNFEPELVEGAEEKIESEDSIKDRIDETNQLEDDDVVEDHEG